MATAKPTHKEALDQATQRLHRLADKQPGGADANFLHSVAERLFLLDTATLVNLATMA